MRGSGLPLCLGPWEASGEGFSGDRRDFETSLAVLRMRPVTDSQFGSKLHANDVQFLWRSEEQNLAKKFSSV